MVVMCAPAPCAQALPKYRVTLSVITILASPVSTLPVKAADGAKPDADFASAEPDRDQLTFLNTDELEEEASCAICTELLMEAVTLKCTHTFCAECLRRWFRQQPICPVCRWFPVQVTASNTVSNTLPDPEWLQQQRRERRRSQQMLLGSLPFERAIE